MDNGDHVTLFFRCRCDDCLLGITDLLATIALYGKGEDSATLSDADDSYSDISRRSSIRGHALLSRKVRTVTLRALYYVTF